MTQIGALVLAAGVSSRMGGNKLLMPLNGKPLVRHAVEAAVASRAEPVIVVTGNEAGAVLAALDGFAISNVENSAFTMGLSSSLKCGLNAMPAECGGAVVLLADMPFVGAALIDDLIAAFDHVGGHAICVPTYRGRRGNPVLWSRAFFPEMLALEGDVGAKSLIAKHEDAVFELEAADDGPTTDIDTPAALAACQSR